MALQNSLLLDAALLRSTPRTPVWIMRQAGRYLPEYRAVRAKVDFLTLCKTPELAAEVTIQPVDILGVDAAIIFSDILVVPEAMGMHLVVEEGKGGPRFTDPIRSDAQIAALEQSGTAERLQFVYAALSLTKRLLNGRVPLIGFAGAPWTLATYMIEGSSSKDFKIIKQMMYSRPELLHALLGKLADVVSEYLIAQIRNGGADIVQIFDTWAGILSKEAFLEFSLPYIARIVDAVKSAGAPVIVFAKGANNSLKELSSIGANVLGLDWTTDLGEVREMLQSRVALQGNLDPVNLYAAPEKIHDAVEKILQKYGPHPGHIFNLGHGILPDVPVEHAKAFVNAVKELSVR